MFWAEGMAHVEDRGGREKILLRTKELLSVARVWTVVGTEGREGRNEVGGEAARATPCRTRAPPAMESG